MAESAPNAVQPLSSDTVSLMQFIVAAILASMLIWHNIERISQFTTVFVDRAAAAEACMTARTIDDNLTPRPTFPFGSAGFASIEYAYQQNALAAARAARDSERRYREILLRSAAERSRDLELRRAAASGAESVVRVCTEKGYPR